MVTNLLLLCGVISSVLYLTSIDVIAALRHPEYHDYSAQMVSELMAVGAPTRELLLYLFIPYNGLIFAFGAGVWRCAGRATRLTSVALLGFAVVSTAGLLLYPMDVRGTVGSLRSGPHIAATAVQSMFVLAAIVCGSVVHGRRFRLYSLATLAIVVAFGILAVYLARPMPGPTPWIGLAERINIYATMIWISTLSVTLVKRRRVSPVSPRPA